MRYGYSGSSTFQNVFHTFQFRLQTELEYTKAVGDYHFRRASFDKLDKTFKGDKNASHTSLAF